MKVYPCRCPEGHFLQTEPAIERDTTKAEADRLTATLAFTLRPDGLHADPTPKPALASGGPVTPGGPYIVGEGGSETFVFPSTTPEVGDRDGS